MNIARRPRRHPPARCRPFHRPLRHRPHAHLIKKINALKPLHADNYRDDGFRDDSTRTNIGPIFKVLNPGTHLNSP